MEEPEIILTCDQSWNVMVSKKRGYGQRVEMKLNYYGQKVPSDALH